MWVWEVTPGTGAQSPCLQRALCYRREALQHFMVKTQDEQSVLLASVCHAQTWPGSALRASLVRSGALWSVSLSQDPAAPPGTAQSGPPASCGFPGWEGASFVACVDAELLDLRAASLSTSRVHTSGQGTLRAQPLPLVAGG